MSELRLAFKKLFQAFSTKDPEAVLRLLDDEAFFSDPHYPKPVMKSKAEIAAGLKWAFAVIDVFEFEELTYFENIPKQIAAGEYQTSHQLPNGQRLELKQVFIVEMKGNLIASLRTYLPYPPGGMDGLMLKLSHRLY